jgi:hypothetical protein
MTIPKPLLLSMLPVFFLILCVLLQGCLSESHKADEESTNLQQPSIEAKSQNRKVFGIELRPSANLLLHEVETLYGKKLVEQDNTTNKSKSGIGNAAANVLPDGSPLIYINDNSSKNEDSVVHV